MPVPPPPFADVQDALAWLDSHIDFEAHMPRRRALPTLDRMRALTALLGEPQASIPAVHVTGTNGKGSTSAMATTLLQAKGLSVGTYTSPNLERVNERLARNGEPIDDAAFTDVLTELALLASLMEERPTRFELLTAAALSWFAAEAVDAMVVEVGLGGTWDCTNVVDGEAAVVTNVSYDHTDVLGPTLEGIAADKAGIIKAGKRAVIGETDPELVRILEERAEVAGAASVWVRGRDFGCESNRLAVGGRVVTLWTPGGRYEDVLLPLHGAHQGANAACALAALEAFFGDPLSADVVGEGFAAVRVPGRLEVLGRRPLLLVDGAHNAAGMAALGDALDGRVRRRRRDGRRGRHAVGTRPLRHAGAAGAGAGRDSRLVPARVSACHANGRGGHRCPHARPGGARGARPARRPARRRAGSWTRTGSSWWQARSTSSARCAPTCCPPRCAGRTPGCSLWSPWAAPSSS